MKKLVVTMFALLCAMVLISSCSSDDGVVQSDTRIDSTAAFEKIKTLSDLRDFNNLTLSKGQTRGRKPSTATYSKFEKGLTVASADILGMAAGIAAGQKIAGLMGLISGGTGYFITCAVCGSITGAAASSTASRTYRTRVSSLDGDSCYFLAAKGVYMQNTMPEISKQAACIAKYSYNEAFNKIDMPEEFDYIKRVGEDHNAIVKTILSLNENIEVDNLRGIIPSVSVSSETLDSVVFENDSFKESYSSILQNVRAYLTPDDLDVDNFFGENPLGSERIEQALKYYISLFKSYPESIDEVAEITNGYIAIIEKDDEFTDEEKAIIYAAVSVALYSPQIWCDIK